MRFFKETQMFVLPPTLLVVETEIETDAASAPRLQHSPRSNNLAALDAEQLDDSLNEECVK